MFEGLTFFLMGSETWLVFLFLIFSVLTLALSADRLVDSAVVFSLNLGIPKIIVGATIVSLGTTFPEVIVSVLAAWRGESGIAVGNAVGSIICDTGLILGLASLLGPIPLIKA